MGIPRKEPQKVSRRRTTDDSDPIKNPLHLAKRVQLDCANCGWGGCRSVGSTKPCPRCGGPVVVRPVTQAHRPKGEGIDLLVHFSGEDYADLDAIGAGSPRLAVQQIVTAHLAMRRFEALAELKEQSR